MGGGSGGGTNSGTLLLLRPILSSPISEKFQASILLEIDLAVCLESYCCYYYSTALRCTQPNYFTQFLCTALPLLYCTHTTSLHCTHYIAPVYSTALYSLHFSTSSSLHFIVTPLCHCTSLLCAVLYNALHQHSKPLHFTEWYSTIHCTVFHST